MTDEIAVAELHCEEHDEHNEHNTFLRRSAMVSVGVGAIQIIVRIVGDVVIWGLRVMDARRAPIEVNGELVHLPAVNYPDLPWGFWTSVLGFVVLSLVGAAFWRGQIGEPGRVIDLLVGWIPRVSISSKED